MIIIYAGYFVVIGCCLTLCHLFVKQEYSENTEIATLYKGVASSLFVIFGFLLYNPSTNNRISFYIVIGLFFGMIGDIFLELRYVFPENTTSMMRIGTIFFIIGHLFYLFTSYQITNHYSEAELITIMVSYVIIKTIFKFIEMSERLKRFAKLYIVIVSAMTSFALIACLEIQSKFATLFAIGAVLFLISDIVLLFNTFGSKYYHKLRMINLYCYYIGQCTIALSIIYPLI